jgi:hypothetical protein
MSARALAPRGDPVKLTYRLPYGGTTSDAETDIASDLVGWAGFEPATSASRTGLQPCEQVVYGLRSTGWRCLEPILRLVWRKDGGSPARRVTDSPYVASILTSTHHETAKPEIKVTVSGGGAVLPEGASRTIE